MQFAENKNLIIVHVMKEKTNDALTCLMYLEEEICKNRVIK